MDASQSVTLSGRVREGVAAETAWPHVAALLRMNTEDFAARVQPRLPLTLKATTAESAQRQEQALRQIGIEAVALPADGPRALLRDGEALRGPVSTAWLRHALETGSIQPGAEVRGVDAAEWQRADVWLAASGMRLDLDDAPATSAQDPFVRETAALPVAEPDPADGIPSAAVDQPTHQAASPPRAGFWRRLAARLTNTR